MKDKSFEQKPLQTKSNDIPSAGPDGVALVPPKPQERQSGISFAENRVVRELTGGKVDLHALGANVRRVSPTDKRLLTVGASSYTQGKTALIGNQLDRGHEIWHLAQQAQNRVRADTRIGGQPVNTDRHLEREADVKGSMIGRSAPAKLGLVSNSSFTPPTTQGQPIQGNGISLLEDAWKKPKDVGELTNLPELLNYGWEGQAEEKELDQLKASFRKLSSGWQSGLGEVLAALLKKYGEKNSVPATVVTFGEVSKAKRNGMARATKMVAAPLTVRPGDTTGSDATSSRWAPYVEGHLLNHLLHGPVEPRNLAPFSRSLNGVHSKNVEEPLKKMIFNENRYFKYTVIPFPQKADVQEDVVPTHINFEVLELKKDDLSVKDDGYQYSGQIDQDGILSNEAGKNRNTVPNAAVSLKGSDTDNDVKALAENWNSLQIPWSEAYGEVMAFILEATYQGSKENDVQTNVDIAKRLYLPKTEIDYSGTKKLTTSLGDDYQVAKKMTAFPLTLRPPDGSGTDTLGYGYEPETPRGWSPYIAGHLLNHHLHGPADFHNLTPMTASLNTKFESEVEDDLKTKVLSQGAVMGFTVEMKNGDDDIGTFENSDFFPGILEATVSRYLPVKDVTGEKLEKKKNWQKVSEKKKTLLNKAVGND